MAEHLSGDGNLIEGGAEFVGNKDVELLLRLRGKVELEFFCKPAYAHSLQYE